MLKFLNNKPLWFHILLALALICILLFFFIISLNWITRHGEASTVPSVTGKKLDDVKTLLEQKGFELVVQDSVFYDSIPRGVVLKQVPEADDVVKINRTVYVTVNRFVPPDVEIPKLKGLSYRNAEMVLRNLGLRIGDTTYKTDFAKNTVLEALYEGRDLMPGAKMKMGSSIDLLLSSGIGDEAILVPVLTGRTYEDARVLMDAQGITPGALVLNADVRDTAAAFIFRQRPAPRTLDGKRLSMRAGQTIDIWLQTEKPNVDSLDGAVQAPPQNEPQQ